MSTKAQAFLLAIFLLLVSSSDSLRAAPAQPWVEPRGILRTRSGLLSTDRDAESRTMADLRRTKSVQATIPALASGAAMASAHRVATMCVDTVPSDTEQDDRSLGGGDQGDAPPRPQDPEARGSLSEGDLRDAELTRSLAAGMHSPAPSPQRERPPMVFLSRHGQSQANVQDLIGMDMGLTREGVQYALRLGQWAQGNLGLNGEDFIIIRSDMVRTSETVDGVVRALCGGHRLEVRSQLNEIHAGAIEGWTVTEFRQKAGEEYQARKTDKLRYKYPGGESYLDLLHRVDPVVQEIRQYGREGKDVLVVAHQATLRCVVARLTGVTDSDVTAVPRINVPLHTIVHVRREPFHDDGGDALRAAKGKYTVVGNLPLLG